MLSFDDNNGNNSHIYDARGRITTNSGVGDYTYSGTSYQQAELMLNTTGQAYYDNYAKQQISYNAFKSPVEIVEEGKDRISFQYNASQGRAAMYWGGTQEDKLQRRYRRYYSADGSMEITQDLMSNKNTFVTYLGGDAYTATAIWRSEQTSTTTEGIFYLFRDYLGSILAITDVNGTIKEKRHFDAWGNIVKLHDGNGNALSSFNILDRGYTGHEHLLSVGLVHMNGRLYDPMLHRFLMPDNFVQDPYNTQNFNRYGYVLNNPLKYTDPSGEFFLIDDLIAGVIGGVINLAVNIVQGNITGSFWEIIGRGAAAFGSGFAAGTLSLYGPAGWAAGGAIIGGTNAWLSGTDVLEGTFTGAVSGLVGGQFGKWAGQLGGVAINGIKTTSPLLQGIIGGSVGGGIGGGLTGFSMSLIGGASFDDALQAGFQQAKTGVVIGGVAGGASAYAHSVKNGVNPIKGKISRFPDNDGFKGNPTNEVLQKGTIIDRYGDDTGRFLSPEGTPFEQRSLHLSQNLNYNRYEVAKPFSVNSGKIAPYFFQKGGGIQYVLPKGFNVKWYLDNEFLKKID